VVGAGIPQMQNKICSKRGAMYDTQNIYESLVNFRHVFADLRSSVSRLKDSTRRGVNLSSSVYRRLSDDVIEEA
jgi:hypothetical protein